jgi:hypothetical protein
MLCVQFWSTQWHLVLIILHHPTLRIFIVIVMIQGKVSVFEKWPFKEIL